MNSNTSDTSLAKIGPTVRDLLKHVCSNLPEDTVLKMYKSAMYNLYSWDADSEEILSEELDERTICFQIEKHLIHLMRLEAIDKFHELHRKLSRANLVKNRSGILLFLLKVSEGRHPSPAVTKLRLSVQRSDTPNNSLTNGDYMEGNNWITIKRETSSPIINNTSIPRPSSLMSQNNNTSYKKGHSHNSGKDIFSNTTQSPVAIKTFPKSNVNNMQIGTMNYKCGRGFAPESAVLFDLIYSFQGISGDIIRIDHEGNFIIDPQVEVKSRSIVEGLLEVGYLHNKVCSLNQALSKLGSVGLSVQAAVTYKLRDYYGFVGNLSAKVAGQCSGEDTPLHEEEHSSSVITFISLRIMLRGPLGFLKTLTSALSAIGSCYRGGAIISILHTLSHNGDSRVSETVNFLLSYAGKPLMKMIQCWVVHGELMDPYDEFFITMNQNPDNRNIWHNKFHIRSHLVPNIITEAKAEMILKCGKAIHFLNIISNQRMEITGSRLKLHQLKDPDVVTLFQDKSELSRLLLAIYEETSALVLDTLTNEFKLYQHFLGLRKYILLGQGDFATSYVQLLEPEMRKEAKRLLTYKLNGLLSSAIRASSASFEDPDIINRVQVKLLPYSEADSGYDIFSLYYIMNEPIATAFKLNDGGYSHMFNFLWRTKSMNHILMNLVKSRTAIKSKINKLSKLIPEVNDVLIRANTLSMELFHFAKEFEYYLQFEVIECVWEKFSESFRKAKTLDDVIEAHDNFVSTIETQTFLDPKSRNFINDLRSIWELVCKLEELEEKFCSKLIEKLEEKEEEQERANTEGLDWADESDIRAKDKSFVKYLLFVKAHYDIFIRSYQDTLKKFLLELSTRKDYQLRMLSAKLDYNEFYKRSDARITDSMKFSRCSDIFSDLIT